MRLAAMRVTRKRFAASTNVFDAPGRDDEKAGIIAFQREEYYYPMARTRVAGRTVDRLETQVREGRRRVEDACGGA